MSKVTKQTGTLEIDHERGVVYFHSDATGTTRLRLSMLPTPVPPVLDAPADLIFPATMLDVNFQERVCNWRGDKAFQPGGQQVPAVRRHEDDRTGGERCPHCKGAGRRGGVLTKNARPCSHCAGTGRLA